MIMQQRKKRHRTCADRMRRDLAERQRQRRRGDPAGKILLQLLALLSAGLAVLPPLPSLSARSPRPQRAPGPSAPAPVDESCGPAADARERGIDLTYYPPSSRAAPTWSRMVKDLRRPGAAGRKAREMIEYRVPVAAVPWLRTRILLEDWRALRLLGQHGATDAEISAAALVEAKKWEAAQPKPAEPKPDPEPDSPGDPVSGPGLKP
ncbi:hypothetical protein [Gellertiella hungarica]|nr:hypothetical protein [Gellertiella hungarica]